MPKLVILLCSAILFWLVDCYYSAGFLALYSYFFIGAAAPLAAVAAAFLMSHVGSHDDTH